MNKQELIERYKTKYAEEPKDWKHPSVNASRQDLFANFIRDLKQLDEPQKPVVPKFVADWFEENKDDLDNAIFGYLAFWEERYTNSVLYQWFAKSENNPIETLVRMKDGYEVEKEPLYRVKIGEGYFVEYQGRGTLIMPDCNKEIKIFDSKSDAELTAQTIGGTVEEVAER
ncbi:DUF1642 domain-containing protein [Enterococcus sp. PS01304]|uniref:DUF1642 domain-containing protein n=1 Tax=Enterococcus TaxID=1350 RepID=UPI0018F45E77|nr:MULTISPECIES: DUF1642 domain-containing protein [Enterococcus]MBJ7269576.1 DUF1642 domain-containing protein [Enterococcus sp. SS2]